MKKLLILALVATMSMTVSAQSTKKAEAVKKKIERSDAAIADAKKGAKPTTWVDRGILFTDAATAYTSNLIAEIPVVQLAGSDILGQPNSIEDATVSGTVYQKYVYDKIDLYVSPEQLVGFWVVREEAVPNALAKAVESFKKAEELKAGTFAKSGKANTAARALANELSSTARSAYMVGNNAEAGADFYLAYQTNGLTGVVDTTALAFSSISYFEGELYKESLELCEKLISIGAFQDGMTYYYLGSCYDKLGQVDKAISVFEEGFNKYPQNSSVMGGLINIYMANNKNPEKLVELVKKAQELDPTNVSLYLVESQIWDNIGNRENAYLALDKAIEIDPQNMAAYYNYAILKIVASDDIAKEAEKLDINDVENYDKMLKEVEVLRTASVGLLEKALEVAPEDQNIIGILGQMYFVCRDYSDEFAQKHADFAAKHNN